MKKWFIGGAMAAILLTACGEGPNVPTTNAYMSSEEVTHEMEGVNVVLHNYMVETLQDVTEEQQQFGFQVDDAVMTATLTVQNNTAAPIYYSPSFYVYVGNDMSTSIEADNSVTIAPGDSAHFNETYRISAALYEEQNTAMMQVPVAFKQPNSTSSGDALGDFGEWTLPIK